MSGIEIVLSVALGLLVNEFTDISPWLSRKLVTWSARLRYRDSPRAAVRAEELAALINTRPGKLFKLGTGISFASAALAQRLRELLSGQASSDDVAPDDVLATSGPVGPLEEEPSRLVERYLFPTEKFRGEWKRHWIFLVRRLAIIAIYAVLVCIAAAQHIKPRYEVRVIAGIVGAAVLLAVHQGMNYYVNRFLITNKRLVSVRGLVWRRTNTLPLLRVTDIRYRRGPLGRLMGYGTFLLDSGSRRSVLRKIVDLPNPNELYLRLIEEMYEPEAVEARMSQFVDQQSDQTAATASDQIELQQDILRQLSALSTHLTTLATAISQVTASGTPTDPSSGSETAPDGDQWHEAVPEITLDVTQQPRTQPRADHGTGRGGLHRPRLRLTPAMKLRVQHRQPRRPWPGPAPVQGSDQQHET